MNTYVLDLPPSPRNSVWLKVCRSRFIYNLNVWNALCGRTFFRTVSLFVLERFGSFWKNWGKEDANSGRVAWVLASLRRGWQCKGAKKHVTWSNPEALGETVGGEILKIEVDIANCYGLLYLQDVSIFSSRMGPRLQTQRCSNNVIHIIWIWFDWYEIDIKVEVIWSGIGWCYQIYLQKIHLELFCAKSTLGQFFSCVFFFRAENESQVLALAWVHTWSTKTRQSRDDFWGRNLRWSYW